jgi:hypothetical protein
MALRSHGDLRVTGLSEKIDNGLDEARILVLGTEVLLGESFRTALRPEFTELPSARSI